MTFDVPYVSYAALYVISVHLISCNSRTSSHWRINLEEGKVISADSNFREIGGVEDVKRDQDLAFSIITSCKPHSDGEWSVYSGGRSSGDESTCSSNKPCEMPSSGGCCVSRSKISGKKNSIKDSGRLLDCGKIANFTYYDHLMGIADRHSHPHIHDPNAIMTFSKNYKYGEVSSQDVDMDEVEKRLWKARKEKPRTTELYNQIGNYWRVKGDSLRSVECFRKALSVSPNNADVLLNLARLLFNLQYLEDAIYLTKRSLDLIQSDQSGHRNAWMQHYTLGEILRAYGHYHEASLHIRHVLDLNPNYQPAIAQLRDMETLPDTSIHLYTLCIIVFLVFGVLFGIIFSTVVNGSLDDFTGDSTKQPIHRRFNRAVAMRSIKMGMNMNPRSLRFKKNHS